MKSKELFSHTFSSVVIVVMLLIVAILVRWEFFSTDQQRPSQLLPTRTRQIKNWQDLKLTGYRSGPLNSQVQIVEFFDYECPFCKATQPAIKAVRKKYPKKVVVVHENFPLQQIHPYAFKAAIAAECVRRANPAKFMAYHDLLFANQLRLGSLSYVKLAKRVGITDTTTLHRCIKKQKTTAIIKSGQKLGNQLNISGIPALLINGTLETGAISTIQLDSLVQIALANSGK